MKKILIIFGLCIFLLASGVSATVPSGGVSHWNFDNLTDQWGSNDATNNGATSSASYPSFNISGDSGPDSFDFDGNNDYQSIPDGTLDFLTTKSFSISMWINPDTWDNAYDATRDAFILFDGRADANVFALLWKDESTDQGKIAFTHSDGVQYRIDTEPISLNTWNTFVYSYDADTNNGSLYLNGELQSSTTAESPEATASASSSFIGDAYAHEHSLDGQIDEVKIFSKSLDTTEVENLYNYGSIEGAPSNPISISLTYPTNGTTYYGDYNGSIITELSNVQGSAECIINDSRWSLVSWDRAITDDMVCIPEINCRKGYYHNNGTVAWINNTAIPEENVSITISCTDYSYDLYNTINSTTLSGVYFVKYNKLNINVYDEATGDLINQNISLTLYNDDYYNSSFTIENGSINITRLANGTYTATLDTEGYNTRSYFATLGYGATTTLNAYLDNSTNTVIFTVQERNTNRVIEEATVTVQKYVDNVKTTVNVLKTDVTGRATLNYEEDTPYIFLITKDGYEDKSFELNPVIFSTYTINMDKTATATDTSDFAGITLYYTPKNFREGINNLSTTISSADGELEYYWINVSYPGGSNSTYYNNAYGSTHSLSFNITNATYTDKVHITIQYKSSRNEEPKTYKYSHGIIVDPQGGTFIDNLDKTYGLGILERLIIFTGFILLFGGVAFYFGGVYGGVGISLLVIGFFAKQGFVPIEILFIPMIGLVILVIWGVSR